ncbi:hypothetical protein ACSTJ7_09585 [Vibrio parahaemolyticus]|uniref:hypothetical protein n=1 Tax=Vibrio parahaemolyticus TaxID=670 RepID=UPI00111E2B5E|nr:hypothetical protein [Vibrio parahaemolyticus]EGR2240694.1 hypothetical protein [Vibrio cholerae]EHR5480045.1 hypothetical protein [Vibrio parahaemolyticus]TOF96992.1 hypothetical protein CGJ10_22920 [Vibrio parahaemolyticus]HCE1991832.1 hypothetical protein [Vibrio parahaemolyticus]HCG8138162.1 hypothetical protein [Vibrio parahaemolyticus]
MLPPKIHEMLDNLIEQTKSGQLTWDYNDDETYVSINLGNSQVCLVYGFDEIEGVSQFIVKYYDGSYNKMYSFMTNQTYRDFDKARYLYDLAQSSGLRFNF